MADEEGEGGDAVVDWRIYMQACTHFLLFFLLHALLVQLTSVHLTTVHHSLPSCGDVLQVISFRIIWLAQAC